MTDKERLEKAKKILNHIKGYDVYDGGDDIEVFEWLIQQAERVQELELEINDWRAEVHKWQLFYKESEESHLETKELLKNIVNQNKRYREAIEVAIDNMAASDNLTIKFALGILEQTLEGEE